MEPFLNDLNGRYASDKKTILTLCLGSGGLSVADFSRELSTSIPKVTRILNEMMQEGYLAELGKQESATGRKPVLYGLNPQAGYFVGVDVGMTALSIAVTDFPGHMVFFQDEIPFVLEGKEESVEQFCTLVLDQLAQAGIGLEKVRAFGVNLTGRVNHSTGYSYSYFIGEEKPIRDLFQKGFGKYVSIENDSRAMAYGEYMTSYAHEEDNTCLFLNASWGLGMGMILDGKLFTGKNGFSGEIGHFPMLDNNVFCRCGKVGCLETGASGFALQRLVKEKLADGRASLLLDRHKNGEDISLGEILDAVNKEDVVAIECVEEVGATLGRAVAGLINVFNPGLVVIGGRLSVTERYLMPPLKSAVNKYSLNLVSSNTVIKASRLGKEAGAIGASLLSKSRLLDRLG